MTAEKIWLDPRGRELRPGLTVAYNFSGTVAVGELTAVKTIVRRSAAWPGGDVPVPRFTVRQTAPKAGHVSVVTCAKNLLVIDER